MPEPISAPDSLTPLRPDEWRLVGALRQTKDAAPFCTAGFP